MAAEFRCPSATSHNAHVAGYRHALLLYSERGLRTDTQLHWPALEKFSQPLQLWTHGQWLDVFIGQLAETSIFTLLRGTNSRSKLKQTESAWIIFWVISVAYTTVIKTKTEESQWASHFFMCFEFPRLHLMINSIGKVCAFSFVNLESISESQLNV